MKATKNKKGCITLIEIDQEDWLFMRAEYQQFASLRLVNNLDILILTILQEFFVEKYSTIYLEKLPSSVKLKNYEAMAFSVFLANRPYYGLVSQEIKNNLCTK